MVINISEDTLRNAFLRHTASDAGMTFRRNIEYPEFKSWAEEGDDPEYAQVINQVDSMIKHASVSLSGIRTQKIREEVGLHHCAANLVFANNGNELPITYTSQLTDDGESIVVEISGL